MIKWSFFIPLYLLSFGTIVQGQTINPCNCPDVIEKKQETACAPLQERLYIGWSYAGSAFESGMLQNVQVSLDNANNIGSCVGTLGFTYSCPGLSGRFGATLPTCYTGTITKPSGTLLFSNGLSCRYEYGNYVTYSSSNGSSSCPPKCTDASTTCLSGFTEYVRDLLNITDDCRTWNGPCNTESKIYRNGAVSIGTESFDKWHKLTVKGKMLTEQVKICQTEWCDYVFEPDYCLRSLPEVSDFIQQYGHLPGCTPGSAIHAAGGFSLDQELKNQQEKIEEAFLHLINLKKQLDAIDH